MFYWYINLLYILAKSRGIMHLYLISYVMEVFFGYDGYSLSLPHSVSCPFCYKCVYTTSIITCTDLVWYWNFLVLKGTDPVAFG